MGRVVWHDDGAVLLAHLLSTGHLGQQWETSHLLCHVGQSAVVHSVLIVLLHLGIRCCCRCHMIRRVEHGFNIPLRRHTNPFPFVVQVLKRMGGH
jgi:hypothetical protein